MVTNHEVTTVNYTPRVIDVTATTIGGNEESIKNALISLLNPEAKFSDNTTFRWDFGDLVPVSIIQCAIHDTDELIEKVTVTVPAADVQLSAKELPLAGTLDITVQPIGS